MAASNKLAKNTFIYALGDIIPKLFSLITFPILTTYLDPEDYGIVNYVTTINTVLLVIGLLSLNTYYLVYFFKCNSEEEKERLLGNLFTFQVFFNLALMTLLYAIGPWVFSLWGCKVDFYPYLAIGIAWNFFEIIAILPAAFYRVIETPLPLTIIRALKGLLSMVLVVLFVKYYKADATSVLLVNLLISFTFGLYFIYVIIKHAKININIKQLKQALCFSLPILPGALSQFLYTASDRILIEKYLGLNELGIYSTAFTLAFLLGIVNTSAYQSFEPHFFNTIGKYGFEQQFERIRNVFLFVILFGALCLGIFSREFFIIFSSSNYHSCYIFVPIFLVGAVFSGIKMMYSTIIVAQSKTKVTSTITIAGGIFSIILNICILPHTGIYGASLVSALTYAVLLLLSINYATLNVNHGRPLIAIISAFALMAAIVYTHIFDNIFIAILIKAIEIFLILILLKHILCVDFYYYLRIFVKK